jgi:hypothetical protein
LKETAKSEADALRLKQMVFERLNSGGERLTYQETRNAIFDGPLNRLCIKLSKVGALCRLWGIPEPEPEELNDGSPSEERAQNEAYRRMEDVELVLRFFAYRQKHRLHKGGTSLAAYLDTYLQHGNNFTKTVKNNLETLFVSTISLVEETFGENAFWLFRRRGREGHWTWSWFERPTTTVYDPLMFVMSAHLDQSDAIRNRAAHFQEAMPEFYRKHYEVFEGRNVNPSTLLQREQTLEQLVKEILAKP